MEFQRSEAYVKRDMGLICKTNYTLLFCESRPPWPTFVGVTWIGKVHALPELRSSRAYESDLKAKIGLTPKTEYVVLFGKTRPQ